MYSIAVPHCFLVFTCDNSRYSYTDAERLVVVLFWLHLWEFLFNPTVNWTRHLWISIHTLHHWAMVTSGFHLWQFQIFHCGTEGLVEVFFWLDLGEFPFIPLGLELGTIRSLILHSTTVPWWHLIFTSYILRYIPLVHWDMWLHYSVLTCERFFLTHPGFNWGPLDLLSCTLPLYHSDFWFLPGTVSCILIWCRGIGGDWTSESFFLPHQELKWGPLDL